MNLELLVVIGATVVTLALPLALLGILLEQDWLVLLGVAVAVLVGASLAVFAFVMAWMEVLS